MTKEYQIAKLYFNQPLALMSGKKDEFQNEVLSLPSDMLKAAILSGLAKIDLDNVTELNEDLIVSSAYLFYNDRYFFPKPMTGLPVKDNSEIGMAKKIKKIAYLDLSLFEKTINQTEFEISDTNLLHGGKFLVADSSDYPDKLYAAQTEERVQIGNINLFATEDKSAPFYVSRTYFYQSNDNFRQHAGLYFIYRTQHEDLLRKALEFLQDEGLGADKNVGNGRFNLVFDSFKLNIPDDANKQIILSKYIPEQTKVQNGLLNNAHYLLDKRGGYIAGTINESYAHWQKRSVFMLREASVFDINFELTGKNVILSTTKAENILKHKVYRDGRPVSIPVKF